jgi:hypothetical protein
MSDWGMPNYKRGGNRKKSHNNKTYHALRRNAKF